MEDIDITNIKLIDSYDEIENIRTFVFEPSDIAWQPGQYASFDLPDATGEENNWRHWFTIASAPSENEIHITTRISDSIYKQSLSQLPIGVEVTISAPDGDFLWADDNPVILVAGGIGVTPYRSMLIEREATSKPLNARLVYYSRTDKFTFKEEFDQLMSEHPELEIIYISGEHITADGISKYAAGIDKMPVYLSGPEPMVENIGKTLLERGVNLKQDWFPGYSDTNF